MASNIITRLKAIFGLSPLNMPTGRPAPARERFVAGYDREPSARDYELYYWCSTPAPWY